MDGQHPDLVAGLLQVALDLRGAGLEPGQEALQVLRVRAAIGQGKVGQFLDRLAGLRAQPRLQARQAAARGFNVLLAARRREQLRAAASVDISSASCSWPHIAAGAVW